MFIVRHINIRTLKADAYETCFRSRWKEGKINKCATWEFEIQIRARFATRKSDIFFWRRYMIPELHRVQIVCHLRTLWMLQLVVYWLRWEQCAGAHTSRNMHAILANSRHSIPFHPNESINLTVSWPNAKRILCDAPSPFIFTNPTNVWLSFNSIVEE